MNEMKYCIWCGTAYTREVKHCTHCGKNPDPAENQLADWLYSHTKEKLKGDIEGSLYEKLKNWLLSHLYGVVLSVTLIAATVSAVAGGNPAGHIEKVNQPPFSGGGTTQPVSSRTDEQYTLSEYDKELIQNLLNEAYGNAIEAGGGAVTEELLSIWAPESLVPYQLHHAFADRWDDLIYKTDVLYGCSTEFDMFYRYGVPFTTTGKELQEKGYEITVVGMDMTLYSNGDVAEYYPDYYVTMVKVDGNWRVAEEINTHSRWAECGELWIMG